MHCDSLAINNDNNGHIGDSDGDEMIIEEMWMHYKKSTFLTFAFEALSNMAVNHITDKVVPLKPKLLEVIISRTRNFPYHGSIQE